NARAGSSLLHGCNSNRGIPGAAPRRGELEGASHEVRRSIRSLLHRYRRWLRFRSAACPCRSDRQRCTDAASASRAEAARKPGDDPSKSEINISDEIRKACGITDTEAF